MEYDAELLTGAAIEPDDAAPRPLLVVAIVVGVAVAAVPFINEAELALAEGMMPVEATPP